MRSSVKERGAKDDLTPALAQPGDLTRGPVVTRLTRRPASAVTLAYLLVTAPLILNAGSERPAWVLALHVAFALLVAWSGFRAREGNFVADWMPLLLVSFLYGELPYLMLGFGGGPVYHDPLVQGWEGALFRTQPARALAGSLPYAWLSELLHFGYLSYYLLIYAPPLVLYMTRRRQEFARLTAALMVTFTSCFVVFALFPVEGPRFGWPAPAGVPDGMVRRAVLWVLEGGSSRGAAFPSSHAAVAVTQVVALWVVGARRMAAVVACFASLLLVGAVYGGFHYAIDMIAGALVGVTVGSLVPRVSSGE